MMAKAFDQKKTELLEHLQCIICHESVDDARICWYCSQIFCHMCITNWLIHKSATCPQCRNAMKYNQLIKGNKINQIQESINKLFTSMSTWLCHKHENQQLLLFCYSCEENVCIKCWHSEEHTKHKERIVPFEEAFDHYMTKLKSSLTWIKGRKTEVSLALNRVRENTRENERRLYNERRLFENLTLRSEALVVGNANPVTLLEVLKVRRTIKEQRSSHPVKLELFQLDRHSDFIQEVTVLLFRMDHFYETLQLQSYCEAFQDAPFGGKWRCTITERSNANTIANLSLDNDNEEEKEEEDSDGEDTNEDTLFIYLCLIEGTPGENSVLLKSASEKVHRFELNKAVKIGTYKPVENEDIQELTLGVRQTFGDRIQQMQDYITSLEEKLKPGE